MGMRMPDPFGSFGGMMGKFKGFLQNPMQLIGKNVPNMPQNIQGDPDAMIQYMMDNGIINQDMYNAANQMAKQAQNNPQFARFMGWGNKQR